MRKTSTCIISNTQHIIGSTQHIINYTQYTTMIHLSTIHNTPGKVLFCEPTLAAREAMCQQVIADTQAVFIHPYNNPLVMAGQATIALEFHQQVGCLCCVYVLCVCAVHHVLCVCCASCIVCAKCTVYILLPPPPPQSTHPQVPNLDAVVVPISGGGMISGMAITWKSLQPSIKIIAAEPCGRNNIADVQLCKQAQQLLTGLPKTDTIADGLQANLGSHTWPIVRDLVDAVVTITEEEIVNAMQVCYERLKVVVEPSGAVGLAAVLSSGFGDNALLADVQRVGVVLCGGNADLEGRGLWAAYRRG